MIIRPRSLIAFVVTLTVIGLMSFIPSQMPQTGAYSLLDAVFVPQVEASNCQNEHQCVNGFGPCSYASTKRCIYPTDGGGCTTQSGGSC